MGDNDRIESSRATDGIPRSRPWRLPVLIAVIVTALAVLAGFLFHDRLFGPRPVDGELDNHFPAGVLVDYVPEDSEALLAVNVRSLLESPVGRQHLAPALQHLIRQAGGRLRWLDLAGIKPLEALDSLQISFAPASGGQPLWLVRARLDRSRLQIGPGKLEEKQLEHFRVWEYTDAPAKRTTVLAPAGDMLVVSESRDRVLAALKHASNPGLITVRDKTLRELLNQVDRRQSVWLAASIKNLGSIAGIDDFLLRMVLQPLLTHADSVHGGITCGDDVQVDLHFRASTVERAAELEEKLQGICEGAPGAALFLGRKKDLLPLLRLLGSGKTSREGQTVRLRCRLTADQLNRG